MAQRKSSNLKTYFRKKLLSVYIVSGIVFIAAIVLLVIGLIQDKNSYIYIGVLSVVLASALLILGVFFQSDRYSKMIQDNLIYEISNGLDTISSYQRKLEMTKSNIREIDDLKLKFANILYAFKDTRFIDRKIDETYLHFGYVEGFDELISTSSFMYNMDYLLKLNSYARGGLILVKVVGGEAYDEVVRELMKKIRGTFATKTYIGKYDSDTLIVYVCDVESISTFKYSCTRLYTEFSYSLNTLKEDILYSCKIGGSIFPYSSINRMLNDAEVALSSSKGVNIFIPDSIITKAGEVESIDEANRKKIVLTERLSSYLSNFDKDKDPYHQVDDIFSAFSEYSQFETWGIIQSFSKNNGRSNFKCIRESGADTTRLFRGRNDIDVSEIAVLFEARDENDCFYSTRRDELSPEIGRLFDKHNLNALFCSFAGVNGEITGMTYLISTKKNIKLYKDDVQLIAQELFALDYLTLYYLSLQKSAELNKSLNVLLKTNNNSLYTINKVTFALESLSPDLLMAYGKKSIGKKCYKTLFDLDAPCENCPLLKPKTMDDIFEFRKKNYTRKEITESNTTDFAAMLLTKVEGEKDDKERIYDPSTSLLSRVSFDRMVENNIREETKGSLLFINLLGENKIVRDYGEANLNNMMTSIGDTIIDNEISENVYRFSPSMIAIFFPDRTRIQTYESIEEIHSLIYHTYKANGDILQLNFKYFEINFTSSFKSSGALFALINKGISQIKKIPDNYMCIAGEDISRIASREDYIIYLLEDNYLNKAVEHRIQPVVSLEDNSIAFSEILLRLYDVLRETMLPPLEVVKTATKTQRMGKFDSLNYETALNLYNKYGNNTFKIYNYRGFSINLSSDSLKSNDWLRHLKRFIINNPMPDGYLSFEITEKVIKENLGRVKVWINELVGYKVKWAVDNYNDEFYSIKELKDFGFDIVKTSRKLFLDAMTDPVYKGIIELIVAESNKRGITLIAQGVETESQIKFVKDVGFKYAQGYYFYKPLKTDELISVIQSAKEESEVKGKKGKEAKDKNPEKNQKKKRRGLFGRRNKTPKKVDDKADKKESVAKKDAAKKTK